MTLARPPRSTSVRCVALVVAAALTASVAACGDDDPDESAAGDVVVAEADLARTTPSPDAPVDELVAGIDTFGLEAEQRLAAEAGGNTVLSPVSIATAFAMVSAGAGDTTRGQIAEVFGLPDEPGVHEAMNALTAALDEAERSDPERGDVVVETANTLWAQSGFEIEQAFLDTLATEYGAGVPTTDFENDPDGGRRAINESVAEATRDRITDLMPGGTVTEDTRAVVVNALYMAAPWAVELSEEATTDLPFRLADGAEVDVPMMRDGALDARAVSTDHYSAVELRYLGGDLAMLVLVPEGSASLDEVLDGLPDEGLGAVAAELDHATVDLTLPRWETDSALDLGPLLTDMGLPLPGGTLPGIAPDLEIGAAVHAADITVDEAGTEAAAATAVGIDITSAPEPGDMVTVVADRPYLFAVRHVDTGAPLFVGRVVDPRG